MTRKIRLRAAYLLPLLTGLPLGACGATPEPDGGTGGSSGSSATGGVAQGGASQGGASSGGLGQGGTVAMGSGGGGGFASGGTPTSSGGTAGMTGVGAAGASIGGSAGAPMGGTSGGAAAGAGGGGGAGAPGTGGTDGGTPGGGAGGATAGAGGEDTGGNGGAAGSPPVNSGSTENTGADCQVTAGELAKNNNFPDPFAMNDGTRITTKEQWRCRRNEIKKDLEKYEIGTKPEPPTVAASLQGNTLNVTVTTNAGSIMLSSSVSSPGGGGPHCVAIGMNGNSSLISGCVQVPFKHDQVVAYAGGTGSQEQTDPFYKVYPDLWGQIGNYNAWSWGISRLIDGLEQVKDELNIDMSRIGVHGCSYAGKMALFAGALDERIALTVAQESGGGGINSWRTSQSFTSRTGTNIEKIDNTNYAWFKSSMKNLDPYSLPHDHHELIAMIAPRAIIALGNPGYEWLGDESGYKSLMAAKEVFKALGVEDHIGFDFTGNHGHCQAPQGQQQAVSAFVNKFLKGQDANTSIAVQPQQGGFDLNYQSLIDWETPTLQ